MLIETLDCYNNNLYYLELGMCRDLEYLRCDGNSNLASLAVNSNKLRYLVCYGTKLDTLDLSGCAMMVEVCSDGVFTQYSSYDDYTMEGASPTWRLRCNKGAVVEEDMGIQVNRINFPDDDFRQCVARMYRRHYLRPLLPAHRVHNTISYMVNSAIQVFRKFHK